MVTPTGVNPWNLPMPVGVSQSWPQRGLCRFRLQGFGGWLVYFCTYFTMYLYIAPLIHSKFIDICCFRYALWHAFYDVFSCCLLKSHGNSLWLWHPNVAFLRVSRSKSLVAHRFARVLRACLLNRPLGVIFESRNFVSRNTCQTQFWRPPGDRKIDKIQLVRMPFCIVKYDVLLQIR